MFCLKAERRPATERRRERRWERGVARRERDVPRDARETAVERGPLTADERETRDRERRTRVRRARACPNIRDTHERASESRRLNKASGERERERAGG